MKITIYRWSTRRWGTSDKLADGNGGWESPVFEGQIMRGMAAYYRNEHGESPVALRSPEDVDNLIDELLGDRSENVAVLHSLERPLMPAGVPDHELMVGADGGLRGGVLAFMDDGNFVSLGPGGGRDRERGAEVGADDDGIHLCRGQDACPGEGDQHGRGDGRGLGDDGYSHA